MFSPCSWQRLASLPPRRAYPLGPAGHPPAPTYAGGRTPNGDRPMKSVEVPRRLASYMPLPGRPRGAGGTGGGTTMGTGGLGAGTGASIFPSPISGL
jgi:hypothetical protein